MVTVTVIWSKQPQMPALVRPVGKERAQYLTLQYENAKGELT